MNQKDLDTIFSSKKQDWATPQAFYDKLNERFHFTLDPCADETNHKCDKYFTEKEDGLKQDWSKDIVFCNPPYGRDVGKWVKKAYHESRKGATVVMLIFARTDTAIWHDYIFDIAKVEFIRGRLKFGDAKNSAPMGSALVIFYPPEQEA
jgi:phage N-6-adenine-methyltransferase